jgi:hypothetical protein
MECAATARTIRLEILRVETYERADRSSTQAGGTYDFALRDYGAGLLLLVRSLGSP